ncbi:DUF2273 domain-containing protein [Aquipuribacter nitratireducens]|uniref:DUF2273 domain-containing protein n=1 Tax=Aquipuribacter nitratireducens TaxID=650104 RepID=A0ABW0GTU5_9MICO
MTTSAAGLLAGLLLALAWTTGGFTGLLLAIVLGGIGLFVGALRDGYIDPAALRRGRPRG